MHLSCWSPCKGKHLSGVAAEQRDPSRVTEQRVCHAAGISLGQRGQRDPFRVTEQRACHAVGISLGQRGQRDPYGVTELRHGTDGSRTGYRISIVNLHDPAALITRLSRQLTLGS